MRRLSIVGFGPWLLTVIVAAPTAGWAADAAPSAATPPADAIVQTVADGAERNFLQQVLDRNPDVARLEAEARAAAERPEQARSLPDPMAGLTAYLWTPETRVGPQRFMASLSQKLPWIGKLSTKEEAALLGALEAQAKTEAKRLEVVTRARTFLSELAFVDRQAEILKGERGTLVHYEDVARARYSSGVGLDQTVIKIQGEITKIDQRLIDIAIHRNEVVVSLNALRDASAGEAPPVVRLDVPQPNLPAAESLRTDALARRPELIAAELGIERAGKLTELAKMERIPDLNLGLSWTSVGRRTDAMGRAAPPEDDGHDILALQIGANLPVWNRRIAAGIEEALATESAAHEGKRGWTAAIDRDLDDFSARLRLLADEVHLYDDVLTVQVEQALRSAETAYAAGTLGALDLLDAERVLYQVRIARARAVADSAITIARLEGTVAGPLEIGEQKP